jgi:hypothetical protein
MTVERRFGRAASGRQKSVLSLFPARSEISLSKRTCEALNGCRFTARRLIAWNRSGWDRGGSLHFTEDHLVLLYTIEHDTIFPQHSELC